MQYRLHGRSTCTFDQLFTSNELLFVFSFLAVLFFHLLFLAPYNLADWGVVSRSRESECFHSNRQQLCEPSVWQTLLHCLETTRLGLINDLLTQINGMMLSHAASQPGPVARVYVLDINGWHHCCTSVHVSWIAVDFTSLTEVWLLWIRGDITGKAGAWYIAL